MAEGRRSHMFLLRRIPLFNGMEICKKTSPISNKQSLKAAAPLG